MTKRKTVGRSFFSNLPLDLRTSLKSQILVPLVPGANINDFQLANGHEDDSRGESRNLLSTQPASPSTVGDDQEGVSVNPNTIAESSTASQKRHLDAELSATTKDGGKKAKMSKKGKGRAVIADPSKRYSGHAWDCTGLVERYTDPAQVPSQLVKC